MEDVIRERANSFVRHDIEVHTLDREKQQLDLKILSATQRRAAASEALQSMCGANIPRHLIVMPDCIVEVTQTTCRRLIAEVHR